ncbi:anaerobic ribonucleoside-triphosphate reductase activating protein [Rhodococcus sp. UYP5]
MVGGSPMTSMLLSRLHYPVRNLGFGRRAGIWFQGCTIYCKGCVSRDTWPFDPSSGVRVDDVVQWLRSIPFDAIDGVTISGGEPNDQPEALTELLVEVHEWRSSTTQPIDILLYSGRTPSELGDRFDWMRGNVDVLVSGPYIAADATDCALRGSANQIVHTFSDLARTRYPADTLETDYSGQRRDISVHVDAESIWMVGIPTDGDMRKLEQRLASRGVDLRRTSWLT